METPWGLGILPVVRSVKSDEHNSHDALLWLRPKGAENTFCQFNFDGKKTLKLMELLPWKRRLYWHGIRRSLRGPVLWSGVSVILSGLTLLRPTHGSVNLNLGIIWALTGSGGSEPEFWSWRFWGSWLVLLHRCSGVGPQREGVQAEHDATPTVDGQTDAADPDDVHHHAGFSLWGGGTGSYYDFTAGSEYFAHPVQTDSPCQILWGHHGRRRWR